MLRDAPDRLVILLLGRSRFEESVLADVDPTLDFEDPDDWIANLGSRFERVPLAHGDSCVPS